MLTVDVPGHANIPEETGSGTNSNLGTFGFESVTDGTSNTAMFSEALVGLNGYIGNTYPGNRPTSLRVSYQTNFTVNWDSGNATEALAFVRLCQSLPATTAPTNPTQWSGACWNGDHAGTLHFNAYNHNNTPNGLSCVAGNSWGGLRAVLTTRSRPVASTPGGVNICFTDGSVRFIKESISIPDVVGDRYPQPVRARQRRSVLKRTPSPVPGFATARRAGSQAPTSIEETTL